MKFKSFQQFDVYWERAGYVPINCKNRQGWRRIKHMHRTRLTYASTPYHTIDNICLIVSISTTWHFLKKNHSIFIYFRSQKKILNPKKRNNKPTQKEDNTTTQKHLSKPLQKPSSVIAAKTGHSPDRVAQRRLFLRTRHRRHQTRVHR